MPHSLRSAIQRHLSQQRVWRGAWIWDDSQGPQENRYVLFRQSVSLPDADAPVVLHLSADTRYRLWVNGAFVGRGPVQSQPYHQFYDSYPLETRGQSVLEIAVEVYHLGTLPHTLGGLIVEIESEGRVFASTDAQWRCCPGDAWQQKTQRFDMNRINPFQEQFDARKLDPDWCTKSSSQLPYPWRPATSRQSNVSNHRPSGIPWSAIRPRPVPFMESEPRAALEIVRIGEQEQIITRTRSEDLSITLSAANRELQHCKVEYADTLLSLTPDSPCLIACSEPRLDQQPSCAYSPSILLDFGEVLTAYPVISLDAPGGCEIRLGYAEQLIDGQFNNAIECPFADSYITRDGRQTWEPTYWRAFRYLKIQLLSTRGPAKIQLHSLIARRTFYPFSYEGDFSSSDPELNTLFAVCRRTIHLCAHEGIMDTPFREGSQWLGDVAGVTLPAIYSCFGDTVLAEKFLMQAALTQRPTGLLANISNAASEDYSWDIPDYSLWWIEAVWQHYQQSGDRGFLQMLYPTISRMLHIHLSWMNEQGLIENAPGWVFIDWSDVKRGGMSSGYNALFYLAVQRIQLMADFMKDDAMAVLCVDIGDTLRKHFDETFWDAGAGLYIDAVQAGTRTQHFSEASNAIILISGLVPPERASDMLQEMLMDHSVRTAEAQPFASAFLLQACRRFNRPDLAFHLLRSRWIERFIRRGETTTPEEWSCKGSWRNGDWFFGVMRTRSHAWSASPADFLIRELAGYSILEAGMGHVHIDPLRTDFDYTLAIPHPLGPIRIEWQKGSLRVNAPDGLKLEQP